MPSNSGGVHGEKGKAGVYRENREADTSRHKQTQGIVHERQMVWVGHDFQACAIVISARLSNCAQ